MQVNFFPWSFDDDDDDNEWLHLSNTRLLSQEK